jgi:polygalacturonase
MEGSHPMNDKQPINVLDFWDGRTDKDGNKLIGPAQEKAVAVAKANGGGEVFFPAGNYNLGDYKLGDPDA